MDVVTRILVINMFKARRLCIPVGMACNLKCLYCMRKAGKIREPKLTDKMRKYLASLNPEETEAVVMNGGEPLLYWDRCKEIFSLISPSIHKLVMTNATLLTQEIVDYLNENNGGLHLSHDGVNTEILRTVDVLKDPKICSLIKQVNNLRVYSCITALNPDIVENYNYIKSYLGKDFMYSTFPCFDTDIPEIHRLIENFDMDTYKRSYLEFKMLNVNKANPFHILTPFRRANGLNVTVNGLITSITDMKVYGTIDDDMETILKRKREMGDYDKCENFDCAYRHLCCTSTQCASEFTCTLLNAKFEMDEYLNSRKL